MRNQACRINKRSYFCSTDLH